MMTRIILKLLVLVCFITITDTASAVPARPGIKRFITLPDGTRVEVELKGDEYCKYWQSSDGTVYVENTLEKRFERTDLRALVRRANQMREKENNPLVERGTFPARVGKPRGNFKGKKKGLIVLVQFQNKKFNKFDTPERYQRIINEIGFTDPKRGFKGSVKDYFLAQSYGQMEFDFDIVGPVTVSKNYEYYGQNSHQTGRDAHVADMVVEACQGVDEQVDFSKYDWDGDGFVEQVFFIYAGFGEATSIDPSTIWPHKSGLVETGLSPLTLDNVKVDVYACSCELAQYGTPDGIDGIGAICHEFSHCMGLPDFYETRVNNVYATHKWDLMCMGLYNEKAFSPAGYTAYERMFVGWLDPIVLRNDTVITNMKPLSQAPEAYIIYNDNYKNECYFLENRTKEGWDSGIPSGGMLITYLDYDELAWVTNSPNTVQVQKQKGVANPHERYYIVNADNSVFGPETDTYPCLVDGKVYNDSLTNTSKPAFTLFHANYDGSLMMNKAVKNITKNEDGTVNFVFENRNKVQGEYEMPDTHLFLETFDNCLEKGGNDGEYAAVNDTPSDISGLADNKDWNSAEVKSAYKCAYIPVVGNSATVTSPVISLPGSCTLYFRSVPFGEDNSSLMLEVVEGNASLGLTRFDLTNKQWQAFNVKVDGTGDVRLKWTSDKPFFIDKICVSSDVANVIENKWVDRLKKKDGRIFGIDGRFVGYDYGKLPKGIYIIDGKKVVK